MAAPRVFISSTYYDLKHVRNDIASFIESLGYVPVMHDKGGVAYTQTDTIENSCYNELANCDIVVCIIGNRYGTQASSGDYSITMEELKTAIKNKKKIYIFISKDVFIENKTYIQNKDFGDFKPAYADNIKIHKFIEELKANIKNNPIESFETTEDIINSLKSQFAGLFQNLLVREASLTDAKTAYDLQESTELFKELISEFKRDSDNIVNAFEGTLLTTNNTIRYIRAKLGLKNSMFIVSDLSSLEEFLQVLGFGEDEAGRDVPYYQYSRLFQGRTEKITLNTNLFDADNQWKLRRLSLSEVEKNIEWDEGDLEGELPF